MGITLSKPLLNRAVLLGVLTELPCGLLWWSTDWDMAFGICASGRGFLAGFLHLPSLCLLLILQPLVTILGLDECAVPLCLFTSIVFYSCGWGLVLHVWRAIVAFREGDERSSK
jgi:hypothetical protein